MAIDAKDKSLFISRSPDDEMTPSEVSDPDDESFEPDDGFEPDVESPEPLPEPAKIMKKRTSTGSAVGRSMKKADHMRIRKVSLLPLNCAWNISCCK